ncbi:MAG: PAS domain S-box protein, partial [Ignavibacteriaceae bacterium]|nr:PAS domain S-box protein [Ignavibacteriaceae bacterium]
PDGIIITELETGKIIEANESVLQLAEMELDGVLGKTTLELNLWKDAKDRDKFVAELQSKGNVKNFETEFRRKSGSCFIGLISGEIIRLKKKKCVLSVVRDISDRKQAEEQLKQKMAELEKFNKLSVGRELRMIELKKQVNHLSEKLGIDLPYNLDFFDATPDKNKS